MWEEILKRFKKLNYNFLKEIVLAKGKEMKGEVLNTDEYLQLQEEIRQVYSKKHTPHRSTGGARVDLNRIRNIITRILNSNNLLEIKTKNRTIFDSEGNSLGYKTEKVYYFI